MDDFFRIPKSLCYLMVKEPLLERGDKVLARGLSSGGKGEPRRKKTAKLKVRAAISGISGETVKKQSPGDESRDREGSSGLEEKGGDEKNGNESSGEKWTNPQDLEDVSLAARQGNESRKSKADRKPEKKRERESFECESCSLTFARKREYTIHMVNHSTLRSHKCEICDKAFKRKSELKCHAQLHSGVKYNCDECDFVTSSKVAVRYHVRRVHQRDFRYKCEECDKSFMSNCELKDHGTSHSSTKSFICEMCGKAYFQKSHLGAHKRTVHGVVQKVLTKEHRCEICNKSFVSEYILQNHIGIHSRKFLCPHCGKEFANNQSLTMHNRMHTGERPYSCKMCDKSFVRSNALAVHELTHTGKRPYVCDLCGKSFTQRSTMMGHRKKHPGTHLPPPPTLLRKLDNPIGSNS